MGTIHGGKRTRSTDEIMRRAAQAATGFRSLCVMPGDSVALYLRNDFEFFEASFGAGLIGAYSMPVNWHYIEEEAWYLLTDAAPKVIVVHADLYHRIVRNALPQQTAVLVVETPPEIQQAYRIPPDQCTALADVIRWDSWLSGHEPTAAAAGHAPDVIVYTSGTTGWPKGVRRPTPKPEESLFQDSIRARGFGFKREDGPEIVTVATGPMYHSAPNAYASLAVRYGGEVILQPRFNAVELLELIERHRVTHLHMVPIMFNRMLELPEVQRGRHDLSSLKFVVHAAAPVSQEVKRRMLAW